MDIRFLTVKEGSTFHLGLLLLGKKRETALSAAFSKITPSLFTIKEGSTSHPDPLTLREEGGNRPTRCSEPLRSKVGGASKPSPDIVRDGTALLQLVSGLRHILRDGTAWE